MMICQKQMLLAAHFSCGGPNNMQKLTKTNGTMKNEIHGVIKRGVKGAIKVRLSKANQAYVRFHRRVWSLDIISIKTKKAKVYHGFDAEVSYKRIQVELEDIFRTKWLRNKADIVDILTPKHGWTRPRGRPRFRLIDGIAQDLEDVFNLKWQEANIPPDYSKTKPDTRSIRFKCPAKSYRAKAHKILYLLEQNDKMILDKVETPWNFTTTA